MKLYVTHVNEMAETVDFAFGNTTFTVLVRDGPKEMEARIMEDDAAYDLPNLILAKARRQAKAIVRDRRKRSLKLRGRFPKVPEQLRFPT